MREPKFMKNTYAVILAGGGGTRLWPISRRNHPKHVLPLLGENSLFQSTLMRLMGLVTADNTFVVTTSEQAALLMKQSAQIPPRNFIIEPQPRGTASAIGLAAIVIKNRNPNAVMIVLPSDHFIGNQDQFHSLLRVASKLAEEGYLVTLGIKPTYPATGYGYINHGTKIEGNYDHLVFRVLKFIEKPDEKKARSFIDRGDFTWNSGIFIWQADSILVEIYQQMPQLAKALKEISFSWRTKEYEEFLHSAWNSLDAETIDFGVMEHAKKVAVIPTDELAWSDVGSWDSLFEVCSPDREGNVSINGNHLSIKTSDSLIYTIDRKLVVTIGVDNLIVIDSGDALLVCTRDQTQNVRLVIEQLRKTKREQYL